MAGTGKKPASDAGRILRDPKSTPKEKEVAASDLAQRRGKGGGFQRRRFKTRKVKCALRARPVEREHLAPATVRRGS